MLKTTMIKNLVTINEVTKKLINEFILFNK